MKYVTFMFHTPSFKRALKHLIELIGKSFNEIKYKKYFFTLFKFNLIADHAFPNGMVGRNGEVYINIKALK